jgi:4-hydroxythreonine-4-phosphate dehydrogenase
MTIKERPIIAITMGDAAGIGPEVIVKALASEVIYNTCCPLLVGTSAPISEVISLLHSPLTLNPVDGAGEVKGQFGSIDILDLHNLDSKDIITGKVCTACGKAAMEYITVAAKMVSQGEAEAMVTAPISKEAMMQAGYVDVGHLEYLARLTHAEEYATMLVSHPLKVVHLTTHYSLREACSMVTRESIVAKLKLIDDTFRKWGVAMPRIGVAALNPHAGEGGLFGQEEIEHIIPAVKEARDLGIDARGPLPADSIFIRAIGGEFDVVLAMYHDQGHIPIKVYGFEKSVSVALGLPLIRTSVDHGTAFDIAGKGMADCRSMEEAIKTAVRIVKGEFFKNS